jgi:hypothetical protein
MMSDLPTHPLLAEIAGADDLPRNAILACTSRSPRPLFAGEVETRSGEGEGLATRTTLTRDRKCFAPWSALRGPSPQARARFPQFQSAAISATLGFTPQKDHPV